MKTRKIIIIAMITLIVSSLFSINVNAATDFTTGASSITVTREISDVSNNVTNTFGYTLTEKAGNPGTVTGAPTSFNIAFNNEAPVNNKATKTYNLDFSGATFSAVGDYHFELKEVSSTNATTYSVDSDDVYDIIVQVAYKTDANNHPTGELVATVVQKGIIVENGTEKKEDVKFPSNTNFTYASFSKKVTGNLADTDEYFTITVKVEGNTGDTYTVTGGSNASNPATITANTNTDFLVKDGETITIGQNGTLKEIVIGSKVTVTEADPGEYTVTVDGSDTNTATITTVQNPNTNKIEVVNNLEQASLTGVFLNIAPFIVLVVIALLGIAIVKKS